MERFFNNAGPNQPRIHYTLPPDSRWDFSRILDLIDKEKYFILHAPRQTGKTSCLRSLRDHLNATGKYRCIYVNIETSQPCREDVDAATAGILDAYSSQMDFTFDDREFSKWVLSAKREFAPSERIKKMLEHHTSLDPRPLIVLFDEVDALIGDTLISFLRQLRSGYSDRPARFPQSIVLCGLRDVKDYRIHSSKENTIITGGSAFNIKAESLRLHNFTRSQMVELLGQHTAETGQVFEPACLDLLWEYSEGQPWLVNALANQVTDRMRENKDRSRAISAEMLRVAAEQLINSRETHLDQLIDKLKEPRVRSVIIPLLAGEENTRDTTDDDIEYVRDLGLISLDHPLRISNALYREVIPRELTWQTQQKLLQNYTWFTNPDGSLNFHKLMENFQQFFREQGDDWIDAFSYHEVGPQMLLQAFLQRIVNGDGRVEREYGLGRKRIDLLVCWPGAAGADRRDSATWQRVVVEIKVISSLGQMALIKNLNQVRSYGVQCNASEAHLVLFDRRPNRSWDEKIYHREEQTEGEMPVQIWGV